MTRRKGSNKTATGTKKKSSARKPQARETTFFQRMETGIWGLGIGLLGLLLFISLAFYEPLDFRGVVGEYHNPIGPLGAWLAHLVYYLLGFGALVLAMSCVTFGAFLIGQRSLRLTLRKLFGFAALLLPSMVVLELALPKGDPTCGLPGGGGGLVGFGLAWVFQALIGQIGKSSLRWPDSSSAFRFFSGSTFGPSSWFPGGCFEEPWSGFLSPPWIDNRGRKRPRRLQRKNGKIHPG